MSSPKPVNKKHARSPGKKRVQNMRAVRKRWHLGTFGHIVAVIFAFILAISLTLVLIVNDMLTGPSAAGSDLLINTLNETSALKFVPGLFMPDEEVQAALARNQVIAPDVPTDVSMITVRARDGQTGDESQPQAEAPIQVYPVRGATYKGYMMVVLDPSRVIAGVCRDNMRGRESDVGLHVDQIIARYNGVAGVNGGAFKDIHGTGDGGTPLGMVYSQGAYLNDAASGRFLDGSKLSNNAIVAGFDDKDILHVGVISEEESINLKLRDALAFGPVLIVNGIPSDVAGFGSGLNPRTAIGQRADGAVLLLALDGRQLNALGASYDDLIQIMLEYGAVNACNMDGGSSTEMYLNGEKLNDGLPLGGSRALPTAWVVLPDEE